MRDGGESDRLRPSNDPSNVHRGYNESYNTIPETASLVRPISERKEEEELSLWHITCVLSSSFSYGCIMTTLFLITLPVECERIQSKNESVPKSVALGSFVAIAGITQLVSPLIGTLSDTYMPPVTASQETHLGQRLPYLILGVVFSVVGLIGQYFNSFQQLWLRYGFFFFLHMIGLNITYSMMITLIPDQVPSKQTGVANGILAFLLVTGSLFGFGLFHSLFDSVQDMYTLYICIVMVTAILTVLYAHDRDAKITAEKRNRRSFRLAAMDTTQGIPSSSTKRAILTPYLLLKTMLYDPIRRLDRRTLYASYTIDPAKHHDFFVITISRLFYYCGMSVQTFFLYFVHDIIHVTDNPEAAVAYLAILGQLSGTFTTYPIGLMSDKFGGRRKPFVYFACFALGSVTLVMIMARTLNDMTILCIILGCANGIYLTMETSLAVDALQQNQDVDDDEPSGGHAQLLGIWGVAAFLGSALGPMLGGPLLYIVGGGLSSDSTSGEADEAYSLQGYAVILCLSSCYFLASAISLRYVRHVK